MSIQNNREPFRAQILGAEKLEQEARALADTDEILQGMHAGKPLLSRLLANGQTLLALAREFTSALRAREAAPPATEWLLDNYYIVEQQLQQARHDLSAAYYAELPKLANGLWAGYPRVYHIAIVLISHTDSHLSEDVLVRFVRAYQERAPLSTGEVWAIAIMLRMALIENLRRLMEQARTELELQRAANAHAEDLLAACDNPERDFPAALARLSNDPAARNPTFVVQLVLRLRDQDPAVAPALQWLEAQMSGMRATLEDLIRAENQRRGVNRVSTGNVITSLRMLAALDWQVFFESVSLTEQALTQDPSGAYAQMDVATRDRYRHVVEALARHNPAAEVEVARRAVSLAAQSAVAGERRQHVGYFLIDRGLSELEADLGYAPPLPERVRRGLMRHATALYLGSLALITFALVTGVLAYASAQGATPAMMVLVALLTVIPLSALAVGAVNWTLSVELKPNTPPKLELENGVPPEYRTMVVIPALIVNLSGLEYLLEHLELRFLANRDSYLHFAILGDFADAPQEHMPEDEALLEAAVHGIQSLNAKYERADAFHFFHRRRQWNSSESSWMGWERKRGKLEEFNRLLRGGETSYIIQEGDVSILPQIKYVITLDADTELPLQAARRLIGTLAHPLNHAALDPVTHIVAQGYGIIQPRVDVVAPAARRSRFAKLFAGDTGLDPYASIVSDVYQDLFQRAVYIGKAIYDVDAMLGALQGRFPDNLLLSHDLVEGGFLRVGFASDIELLEDFPSGYNTYAQRQHRWVRGDWQITGWLLPRVRDAAGRAYKNPLPLIERWKILDNLRRSLVPATVTLLLLAGWTILPGDPVGWTGLALFCILFPFFRSTLAALGERPMGEALGSYLWAIALELWNSARRGMVTLIFLLYQATLNLDAIARVVIRRTLTHRGLLEWTSHAVAERGQVRAFGDYLVRLWGSSALSVVIALVVGVTAPDALLVAAPLLLLWFLAPTIAYSISQPVESASKPLSDAALAELRATARRIWRFYEEFAGAEDHWLPPDNYQLEPTPVIAHRTSPTNIGFLLLSTISAYDFGYIQPREFVERVERVFGTLDQMEMRRGHFYNWYDTSTLAPLHPRYISTVDSGNFAVSLIALKQACLEMIEQPPSPLLVWKGLADTLAVLDALLERAADVDATPLRREVERLRQDAKRSELARFGRKQKPPGEPGANELTLAQFEARALYLVRLAKRLDATSEVTRQVRKWADALARQAGRGQESNHGSLSARLETLARRADGYVAAMEFEFLYDSVRGVFAIGYNVENHRRDDSYYDLLASEARLTSFFTIARGEIPVKHWFRMNRPLTRVVGKAALLSWGGTMFEYLMPPLLLRDYTPSLLQQTELAVIQAQMLYARRLNLPWGISESGFYAFDYQFNYQYRAFGVPELSLKREFVETRVIAPYATFLALPHAPRSAWNNLSALEELGGVGEYGFYEALDFTPEHLPKGERVAVVRSYMAHHQGMSLIALDNYIHAGAMQHRFHREPMIAAAELLLQERVPRHAPVLKATKEERPMLRGPVTGGGPSKREFSTPHTFTPRAHILSNGTYSVMLTNGGGGYSAWSPDKSGVENFVTRWQPDATLDALGAFCYIQDIESGRVWSNTYQPTCAASEHYRVAFMGEKVEFLRRDTGIETLTEIFVATDTNAEVRRLTLSNPGTQMRTLDLTSYAEVVLDSPRGDAAHPAFSKLFVESEFAPTHNALLFKRRPRDAAQPERWAVHFLLSDAPGVTVREHETDRAKFIGRGRTLADPAALYAPLSNTSGATLDPVMSLRTRVRLAPNATVTLAFITGAANSREAALALCDEFLDARDLARTENLAREASQIELRHLGITPADATLYQRFASRVLFPDPQLRASADVISRNAKGQATLWAYGISGDFPIVLVNVAPSDGLGLVRQALLAHEFWRLRNFHIDLVIVDEHATSYEGETTRAIANLIETSLSRPWLDKPGGVYVRQRDQIPPEDYLLFETVARVILRSDAGDLADQLNLSARHVPAIGARARRKAPAPAALTQGEHPAHMFWNGLGGFSENGTEYVITLNDGEWTPAPWSNVLANEGFGCLVTDAGPGMSWAGNSQLNKLTRWSNDPVSDPPSEAVYLQDIATGELWSPTPLPVREAEPYIIRHGAGYSVFEHTSHELAQSLRVSVARDDPVKILQLTIHNLSNQTRHLRATYYAEWVLGARRDETQNFIVTEQDATTNAIFARNVYNEEGAPIAFAAATEILAGWTASRAEFLGRNGSYALPAALAANAKRMSEQTGASLDPCAALQVEIELGPGQETELEFLLGQGEHRTHARALIQKYTDRDTMMQAVERGAQEWNQFLETIQVKSPDPAMDMLLNRWLLYQTLACRVWGRTAFYQSGGAYGFRDQLQDVMALTFAAPELARQHILRAAAHQFPEGDVMHWWHPDASARILDNPRGVRADASPPSGHGVRTRISDDYLWLAYVTDYYVRATGDTQILDEQIPFIRMPLLEPGQEEIYGKPDVTDETASLYEHCWRALEHGLRFGAHGLPLIGTGDWNDGMNRVGDQGKGESVWLGWFLYTNLTAFASLCDQRGDAARAAKYHACARDLQKALEEHGWDGAWYRRAYFDDGTPLGSHESTECKIDAIAQAWAAISNAAPRERQTQALDAVEAQLVRAQERMICLLTPPFDHSTPNPGYIQGYVPGIRENGGQYTHGVLWVVLAHALQGNGTRAHELFQMLNPVNHARTPEEVDRYKVEPYVVAADVYAHPRHLGRGGWTWYTGSAGWMYRIGVEHILGLQRRGDSFTLDPCIPQAWTQYEIIYRHASTRFEITVENPDGVSRGVRSIELDGQRLKTLNVPIAADGHVHQVRVTLGVKPDRS